MENKKTNAYSLVVKAKLDNVEEAFEFDYLDDTSTTLTSEITTHPIVNGDMIADHMYRMPISENVSGKFSLHGNKKYNFGTSDRLARIQDIFERIKNEGIFCTLVKRNSETGDESRFKVRENMVLTSITWTESQSTLGFNFGFQEAMTVNIDDFEYDVDVEDEDLPSVVDPEILDFTDEVIDMGQITKIVNDVLLDAGLLTEDFLKSLGGYVGQGALTGLIVGTGVAIVASGLATAIAGALVAAGVISVSVPVVGWIVGAAVAIAAIWWGAVAGVIKAFKRRAMAKKFKTTAFKLTGDEEVDEAEYERYIEYINKVILNLEYLNDHLKVYGVPKDGPQEMAVYIDNEYYIFSFTKNNVSGEYNLVVKDVDDVELYNGSNLGEIACNTLDECVDSKPLFKTKNSGHQIFLLNRKVAELELKNASKEDLEKATKDLSNYIIFDSQVNMSEFNEMLSEAVLNAMQM